jgi:signal peptidase I
LLGKNNKNNHNNNDHNGDKNDDSDRGTTSKNGGQHEQKKSSKRTNFIPNEAKYLIIAVAAVAIIWFSLRLFLQVENPFYVVSSESMVPTLMVGDIVVLRNGPGGGGFSFSDLQVGDIIVFHTEDGGGRTIVHRIVEIYYQDDDNNNKKGTGGGEERLVKTKGDNNPISYKVLDYPIEEADYYGKVIFVIPKIGLIFKALSTPPVSYIVVLAAVAIIAIPMMLLHYYNNNSRKKRMQI